MNITANRDMTSKMSSTSNPSKQDGNPAMTVKGVMKPVKCNKAASMKLTKNGDYNGHK